MRFNARQTEGLARITDGLAVVAISGFAVGLYQESLSALLAAELLAAIAAAIGAGLGLRKES